METVEQFVDRQIRSGRYENREALIHRALTEMQEREAELEFLVEKMRPAAEAFRRGERGRPPSLEAIKERVVKKRQSGY